jgi:hypothetical protein
MPGTLFLIISRNMAREKGLKKFYHGKPCKLGHDSERYVSTGACVMCQSLASNATHKGLVNPVAVAHAAVKEAAKTLPVLASNFVWSPEVRARIVDAFVDTGSIESARESVVLTPSEYHRELDRTPEFADAIAKATVLAIQTLEERAAHSAMLKGNDKLHLALLKAKRPEEFSERVRVETTHVVKLSNDELDRRIARYTAVDAVFTDAKTETGLADAAGGEAQAGVAELHSDPVPGDGTAQS